MKPIEKRSLSLAPHKARPTGGAVDAWWYENAKSIDVYIEGNGRTVSCRISRRFLEAWLRKAEEGNPT